MPASAKPRLPVIHRGDELLMSHKATSPARSGPSHQPCPQNTFPKPCTASTRSSAEVTPPLSRCVAVPHTHSLPRMAQDALKRPELGGPGVPGLAGGSCGARAGPRRCRPGGCRPAVSPYTAVSKLSCPPPGCAAAGARPGREPAQINSRTSKGTSDAAPPRCPGDTRPGSGLRSGDGTARGRGSGVFRDAQSPDTHPPPPPPLPPVQIQATTAGTGDAALRHVSGSTAPVPNVTLEEGPQSAPPPPPPVHRPQHVSLHILG